MSDKNIEYGVTFNVTGIEFIKKGQEAFLKLEEARRADAKAATDSTAAAAAEAKAIQDNSAAQADNAAAIGNATQKKATLVAQTQKAVETVEEEAEKFGTAAAAVREAAEAQKKAEEETKNSTEQTQKHSEAVNELRKTLQLAQAAFNSFRRAVQMFEPAMREATRLLDISAVTGKSVREIILLEEACRQAGVSSVKDFEKLSESIQSLAFDRAKERVGDFSESMQSHAHTLNRTRQAFDDLTLRVQEGFAVAISGLDPLVRGLTKMISAIPVEAFAASILALSATMVGAGVKSFMALGKAIMATGSLWTANTAAINANTAARALNAATPVGGGPGGIGTAASMANRGAAWGKVSPTAAISGAGEGVTKSGIGGKIGGFFKGGKGLGVGLGLSVAGMGLSHISENAEGNWGTAGRVGGSALSGAGMGMMFGPWGALIGGVVGTAAGAIGEVGRANEKALEPIKRLAAAEQAAAGPLEQLSQSIKEFGESLDKSLRTRTFKNESELGILSRTSGGSGNETTDEMFERFSRKKTALEQQLKDPEKALGAAKELDTLSKDMADLQKLSTERSRLADEQRERALDIHRAEASLALENFIKEKHSAKEIADFRLKQLKELHEEQAKGDTIDTARANQANRQAEYMRLERELADKPEKALEIKDSAGFNPNGPGASDSMTRIGLLAAAPAQSFDYSKLQTITSKLDSLPERFVKALNASGIKAALGTMWN